MKLVSSLRRSLSKLAYRAASQLVVGGDWVLYRSGWAPKDSDQIVILAEPSGDLRRSWANALAAALNSSDMDMACGPVYQRGATDRVVAAGYELGLEGETPVKIPLLAGEAMRRSWATFLTTAQRPSGRMFAVKSSVLQSIVTEVGSDESAIVAELRKIGPWAVVWSASQEGADPKADDSLALALERRDDGAGEILHFEGPSSHSPGTPCLPPAAIWIGEVPAKLSAGLDTGELRPTVAIRHAATDWGVARHWGDHHFAVSLSGALAEAGIGARIAPRHAWSHPFTARTLVITLRGLLAAPPIVNRANVLWVISHPKDLTSEELVGYDLIAVASDCDIQRVSDMTDVPVVPLLQATEKRQIRQPSAGDGSVVFVGNSRGARRVAVEWAIDKEIPLQVYGQGWGDLQGDRVVINAPVDRDSAAEIFNGASVVLGDHWEDMRRLGYVSNRVFDVVAAGGLLISDRVAGMEQVVPGIPIYDSADGLSDQVRAWSTADPEARVRFIGRLQESVLRRHTFDKRVAELLAAISRHVPGGAELIDRLADPERAG